MNQVAESNSVVMYQRELESITGKSADTLRRWVRRGLMPGPLSEWPAQQLAYDRATILAWLRNRGVTLPDDQGEFIAEGHAAFTSATP